MTDMPTLNALSSKGTLKVNGNQMTFVVDNLAETLKKSSQLQQSPAQQHHSMTPEKTVSTVALLQQMESESAKVTQNFNALMEKLKTQLHDASAITVGVSHTYKDALEDLGQNNDEAVKSMYTLMAQAEELDKAMKPVHDLSKKIKHIKTVLTALESQIS